MLIRNFRDFMLTIITVGTILSIVIGITGCTYIATGDNSILYYDKDTTVTDNKSDVTIPLIP